MRLSRLVTYSFDANVGPFDRVFRILSGLALAVFPWVGVLAMPGWLAIALTGFGVAWFLTGVVSRCGLYYLFGLSTRRSN